MERIPQGILSGEEAARRFELSRHEPAPRLRPVVEYYWVLRWDLHGRPPYEQRVLPNLAVHVVFSSDASGVWGPGREVFTYRLGGHDQVLGVRVRPGCCRSLLGLPAADLADGPLPLTAVFGTEAVRTEAAVRAAESPAEMVRHVDRLLDRDIAPPSTAEIRARETVAILAQDPGITRVDQLSAATGLSVRTLQRTFAEHVGVSPKWAIRVYRLNDAARRIAADPRLDQARLAGELGYSDQAHFVRDFTAVVGSPPARYAREQGPDDKRPPGTAAREAVSNR
ncbi:DUF6597 domain-containing transcriptional factor [Prauserella oleivorans]|uniref:DUF6597 domain-containing transcriptional factor n=1 Tax=Prauserella oleivorans TaxID=1478153 RepID=A0ABW5WAF9_9PSEU